MSKQEMRNYMIEKYGNEEEEDEEEEGEDAEEKEKDYEYPDGISEENIFQRLMTRIQALMKKTRLLLFMLRGQL